MMLSLAALDITFSIEPIEESLADLWRDFDRTGSHSFFLTWTWIGAWLRALPADVTPMLLKATRANEVLGLATLTFRRQSYRGHFPVRQAWLNSTGDANLDGIAIEHNGFATRLPSDHLLFEGLAAWFASGVTATDELLLPGVASGVLRPPPRDIILMVRPSPAYRLPLAGIADVASLEALLSRNTRQQLRRSRRAWTSKAPLAVDFAPDVETALDYFDRLKALHVASKIRRGRSHAFDRSFFEPFHRGLIAQGFGDGNIDLLRVTAADRVLGYLYNFRRNGVISYYQSGFDDSVPELRPGYVCHASAIAHYAASGASLYDFLAGANRLKQSFGIAPYELDWYSLRQPTLRFRAEALARSALAIVRGSARQG